jgi:hypothetical protein
VEVVVQTRVNVCVEAGKSCFALPLPRATVEVTSDTGGIATAETDDSGIAKARVRSSFNGGKVSVKSPLLRGGVAQASLGASSSSDSISITIDGALSEDAMSP